MYLFDQLDYIVMYIELVKELEYMTHYIRSSEGPINIKDDKLVLSLIGEIEN